MWVSVEPNIRWHYEVLLWLSQSDVHKLLCFTQHVIVVLPVEHNEKLCFIVSIFEAGAILLLKSVVVILYNGTFEMAFV